MSSTLPLLVVSLLVANPQTPAPRSRGPNNAERAKMGLLPRRAAPSKVTYLTEAARSRADRRAFPEAGAPPVIVEASTALEPVALPAPAEAPAAGAAPVEPAPLPAPLAAEQPEPQAVAVAPVEPAPLAAEQPEPQAVAGSPVEPAPLAAEQAAPEAASAEREPARSAATEPSAMEAVDAPVTPSRLEEPVAAAQTPNRAAPSKAARVGPARVAPAAVVAPAAAAPAVPRSPEHATATVALVTQRFVDRDGRIVVRVLGPKARILSEQLDGNVRDLPVQWAGRTEQGEIVELVEDDWGPIEVRRDPVGRFLSARTVDEPDWQE